MAGGKVAFDATAAAAAKSALAAPPRRDSGQVRASGDDPVTEAKAEIWTNWDQFVAKSEALLKAAEAVDTTSAETIGAGLGAIGGSCKDCHSSFRML